MPRRRFSANSPTKHDQSVTADVEEQIVLVDGTEDSTITPANNVQGIKVIKNSKGDNQETLNQEELSGSECENGGRERSQSTSSSSESRKNRSLEALFQVTDTELKAISKQGPVIGHQYVTVDNQTDSLIVVDSAIQDREELIGDTEIVQDEVTKAGQFLEESMKDIDNSDEEIEDPDATVCDESALHLTDTESAALDQSPVLVEETPKWRQFKNIERILQKAGIDTSSKTWLTLTRPGRHICPYCQRACSKPSVLEKHIRAHTGERPYPCLVCGFSFKTKSNLYKHCKSRAHSMKSNIEMKKIQSQGLSDQTGTELETKTDDLLTDGDVEKRKNEPAQRHVIQEVMKYLEKDKCQRPSEVQTERQRAKLERLKSMQEKGLVEVKKREDPKVIHRQLSLPILPTSHFQKIAPKVDCVNLDTMGEVTYLAKVIVPGINQNELESEPVSEVKIGADHVSSDNNLQTEWKNNTAVETPAYFDQIEIVNLPNSNSDPEMATKALQDLEELSDKFATVAQDGGHLTVHSLPDDRVQVILQLKRNESTFSENPTIQAMSFSEPETSSQSVPTTPVLSRGAFSSAFLKERIQRLILTNAAIIDTPKVDPPRAKCVKVKRNLSRQDSDIAQIPSSVTVTSVPGFIFPTISSVPLQPLPVDTENNNRTAKIETQSTSKIGETFTAYKEREAQRAAMNGSTGIRPSKSVIVERMEYEGEHLMVLDPDRSEDESSMHKDEMKMVFNEAYPDIYVPSALANSSNLTQILPSEVGMLVQKSCPGFAPPLKSIFPQHSTVACMPTQVSPLQKVFLESQNQPMTTSVNSHTLPSFAISPMSTNVSTSTAQSPGYYGKMALKNLQLRSKGLTRDISTPGLKMPPASPSVSAVTHLVGQQQYIVQITPLTPSTAAAQFLLPSQSTTSGPVFVVGESNLTSPFQRSQVQQQTIVLQAQDNQDVHQTVLNYVQSPSQVPAKQIVYPIQVVQRHPIIIQPQLQKSCSSTFMTGSPVLVKASETGSQITHSPLLLQSPVTSDPMKILSKIVSHTVSQQAAGNVQVSKAKEIKIEIKLPPQQQLLQPLASPLTPSKSRPTLKRQGKVQTPTTTLPYVFPVFRFRNVSLKSVGSETPVTTEHATFQVRIDSSKANSATCLSTTQTIPISVSQDKLTSSLSSGSFKQENSLPQRNKVNVSLTKNNLVFNEYSSKILFEAESNICTGSFICSSCGVVFKKQETLVLHKMCYCTKSRDKVAIKNKALEATDLQMGDVSKEIITKLFKKSLSASSHLSSQTENTKPEVMSVKVTNDSLCVSGIKVTNEIVKHSTENVIEPGVITSTASELSLPSLHKSVKIKQNILSPVTQLRKETLGCGEGCETTNVTGKTVKEMLNNLKRQILKRKLKGKLMMKRSLSVDNVAAKQEMRYSDIDMYTEPPWKRSRLHSLEDLETGGISIKSTVFRRSESVPELSKEKLDEHVVMNDVTEELDIKQIPQKSPATNHVHIPVKTAELILHPAAAPIYQQNFQMKSFPGMGTPPQLMPSDILMPNVELIDIDVTKKEFSFDQGECLVKSLKKLPGAVKIDTLDDPGKLTDTLQPVSEKSPKLGKVRSPLFCQMSLVGHTHPSLCSLTHLTFCTVNRLQPCYVKLGKKVSMYSDWRVCEQNKNLLGLPTRALLSLYDSRYTTDPVWVKNCGSYPKGGVVTHSSYWKYKHEQENVDGIMEKIEDLIKKHSLEKVGIQGGFKTTESYVYVRGRGRGKYVCDTCGIRCKKPSMLKKHIRTHTNLRPYKCKHCKFSFKTKGNLTKHMKSRSHHKKCAELGISPVPTSIDESQIDEEALQMQFIISKQAKILDKANKQAVELVDTNDCRFDENESGECIDNDQHVDETMDGEDNEEDTDDNMENIEEDDADSLKLNKQDFEYGVPECIPPLPDMPTPSVTQTQHNLFLQTLGIIAKHQLTDDNAAAVPLSVSWLSTSNAFPIQASPSVNHVQISLSGTQSLALQPTSSLCSVGTSLTLLGQSDALMSDALLKKSNCLSTVYGSFSSNQGSPTSVTKHSDVILGLLRLSGQSKTTTEATANGNQVDGVSQMTDKVATSLDGKPIAVGTLGHNIASTLSTHVYIPLGGNEPPFRNTLASSDWLMEQCSSEQGPIVGQIIQSVGAPLKSDDNDKQQQETVFLPFQFLHPFPGSMIMSSATSMTSAVKPSFSTDSFELHNNNHIDLTSDTENESHTKLATDYIYKVSDAGGNTNQNAQAENLMMELQPIHIVNLHPNLFDSHIVQKSLGVNVTQTSLDKSSILVKSLPELSQSLNKSITNSLTTISAGGQCTTSSTNIKDGNLCHVTGSVAESGNNGRFMCTICRTCFPEHHQLFLHGNVHLLEHIKMKCRKCNLTFRSHYAYEKHLHSDLHAENEAGEVIVATSENPRPFKCQPCETAFRTLGHLTKHFRSRAHFKNFENTGRLPAGTWELLEHCLSELDVNSVDRFLVQVNELLNSVGQSEHMNRSELETIAENEEVDDVFVENNGTDQFRVEMNMRLFESTAKDDTNGNKTLPDTSVNDEDISEPALRRNSPTTFMEGSEKQNWAHVCSLCGKEFANIVHLKDHVLSHVELRPYVCECCDAGFTNILSLKKHMYCHTQEVPRCVCGICGSMFNDSSVLSDHCRALHTTPNNGRDVLEFGTQEGCVVTRTTCEAALAESENGNVAAIRKTRNLEVVTAVPSASDVDVATGLEDVSMEAMTTIGADVNFTLPYTLTRDVVFTRVAYDPQLVDMITAQPQTLTVLLPTEAVAMETDDHVVEIETSDEIM